MKKKIIIAIVILACIGCGGGAAYYYNNNKVEVKSAHTQTSTTSTSTKNSTTMISSQNSAVANGSNNSVQAISQGYNNSVTSSKANTTASQTKFQVANSGNIEQMYEQETKNNTGGVMDMGAVQSYTTTQSTGYTIDGKINGIPYTNIQNGIIYDTNAVIQVGNFGGLYDITSNLGYAYIYYHPNTSSELLAKVTNYFKVFVKGCYGSDWYYVEVSPGQGDGSKQIAGFVKACYLTYGIQTSNKGSIAYI